MIRCKKRPFRVYWERKLGESWKHYRMSQLILRREQWQVFWQRWRRTAYCVKTQSTNDTFFERYVFRTTSQEDRAVDVFVRRRAEYCEFGALNDFPIRDQIVVGINDPNLRERLLRETDLSLERAIKLCRITEQSKEQSKYSTRPQVRLVALRQ